MRTAWVFVQCFVVASAVLAGPRSPAVRAEFQRLNPCPATGERSGACKGWEIDHVRALVCGGFDELGNLQWLSVADHRVKTRADVAMCKYQVSVRP
jgi:hypothetical protein